jgi:UDP-galactopyranose mutase
MSYDYLIVGSGLFGSIVAHELKYQGKSVLVIEKNNHLGGTIYTELREGIHIHKYGAHVFRTSSKEIWDYMNCFGEFNHYVHSPLANYRGEIYNLPINMNTFSKLWNIRTPAEALEKLSSQIVPNENPKNLEEFVLSTVGTDVYEKLIKGYTEKQWGVSCTELPADTMRRVPIRFTYNNNYYTGKKYQGVPINGYTGIIESMLEGIEVILNCDGKEYLRNHPELKDTTIIYTGCIDEFFDYKLGRLAYRTLRFEEQVLDTSNYQGNSVVNYTDRLIPFTRIIEHKHFTGEDTAKTIITKEYPKEWEFGDYPYYPMLDDKNKALYDAYVKYARVKYPNIVFCGKLGSYIYTDMEDTIKNAFDLLDNLKY